ncbi:hypothetical protein B0H16DRAFT_1316196 [Mycena metata]|uniref:CxC2-like cysteine cluster KDZ transposase-associated domain-containing protein n=1 Tax=Mycena metata TaxID=1033252 RepID=A0AAD7MGZ8_9AGAR|nr:hypothetical protein B0H16DRAFT_1338372 [Mycena metata]KAJ7754616.1 hypothetical protein B0H16DRAFT_1316196 [Mycena metata]
MYLQKFPLKAWIEYHDEYLDEMLRLEGHGGTVSRASCASCGVADPMFRCAHQLCMGPEMFCQRCIVQKHAFLPTHIEWNEEYFEHRSLYELGLVMQLGHRPGFTCPAVKPADKDFVIIDVTGVHYVRLNFCECDACIAHRQQSSQVLFRLHYIYPTHDVKNPQTCAMFAVVRMFQILNCLGKVSAHDFVRTLELLTNNDGLNPPANCRRSFRLIVCQYRMTQMMKCCGRSHAPSGVLSTAQGELALQCRACPQPGRNLPDGWDRINWSEMPEDLRYTGWEIQIFQHNLR